MMRDVNRVKLSKEKVAKILDDNYWGEVYGVAEAMDFLIDVLKSHGYDVEIEE